MGAVGKPDHPVGMSDVLFTGISEVTEKRILYPSYLLGYNIR